MADDAKDPDDVPDGRAARAERRRAERREAILAAAKTVFRDKGYHQASVHDIIDEARIARGTFYLYFTSKQELFGELVDDFLARVRGEVRRISLEAGDDPPRKQLQANFRRVVATVLEHADVASIILRDPTSFDEESRARVNQFFAQVLELTESAIGVGQTIGLVGPCDVQIVSAVALGGLRAALIRMLNANSGSPEARARDRSFTEPERMADELLDFFLRGVSRREGGVGG
jgi:AcrR family transcriptional regulator